MEDMNDGTLVMLRKALKGKRWLVITETENKSERDVFTNIKTIEERRQLLANIDHLWTSVIENEKRKGG